MESLFRTIINKIKYYVGLCERLNLDVKSLRNRIKSQEYERLDETTRIKLIKEEKLEVNDLVPNPIIIKSNSNYEVVTEKVLQKKFQRTYHLF